MTRAPVRKADLIRLARALGDEHADELASETMSCIFARCIERAEDLAALAAAPRDTEPNCSFRVASFRANPLWSSVEQPPSLPCLESIECPGYCTCCGNPMRNRPAAAALRPLRMVEDRTAEQLEADGDGPGVPPC
jgi:hypothetical protein